MLHIRSLLPILALSVAAGAQNRRLDTTNFVVIGEGLAAGQADFGLSEASQRSAFPALVAERMGALFPQPLIQGPGLIDVLGMPPQTFLPPLFGTGAVRVQARARPESDPGPPLFVFNVSAPNARLTDALTRRPAHPLIHEHDRQQTALNLILGFPQLLFDTDVPLWTQAEYAEAMNPTLSLVELGFYDALEAAVFADPARMAPAEAFRRDYAAVVERLRRRLAEVIVTTVPDPFDTAFFATPAHCARLVRMDLPAVLAGFALRDDDRVTRQGVLAMGYAAMVGAPSALDRAQVIPASAAAAVAARVDAYNDAIREVAAANGAVVYDLASLYRRVREEGAAAGSTRLTADYLGGFYSLDGYYPGRTGHALIANEIVALINRTYGESFPLVDLSGTAANDPAARHRQ
ncbi:MAG: hypothetical protein R2729_10970 [Bryobacteraceae bacterium]